MRRTIGRMTYPELPSLAWSKNPSTTLPARTIIRVTRYSGSPPVHLRHAWWTADTVRDVPEFEVAKGVGYLNKTGEEIIRVAIVDDQRLFTKGLSGLVDMLPGVEVVGVAYDGEEAITLCRKEEPDVVLMDISMPKIDGISATREIKALLPQTAVVILRS